MQRGMPVLPFSLAGFFSRLVISSLQAAKFGLGCRNLRIKNRRKAKRLVPLLAGLCLYALSAQAQNKTWIATTGDWANGANWEGALIGNPPSAFQQCDHQQWRHRAGHEQQRYGKKHCPGLEQRQQRDSEHQRYRRVPDN